jgi:putative sigma-54 modulation protein
VQLRIVGKGLVVDEGVRGCVRERVDATLDRLASKVASVRIQLTDENGPRGGLDKRCVLTVTGSFETKVVDVRDSSVESAVGQALHIASRSIVRSLERDRLSGARTTIRGALPREVDSPPSLDD